MIIDTGCFTKEDLNKAFFEDDGGFDGENIEPKQLALIYEALLISQQYRKDPNRVLLLLSKLSKEHVLSFVGPFIRRKMNDQQFIRLFNSDKPNEVFDGIEENYFHQSNM